MPKLGVNIDHFATIRKIRQGIEPDPMYAALHCQYSGADSIVAHLREDRRHINELDIRLLKKLVKVKFNLEMSTAADIVEIACEIKPDQATLVPEKRLEVTTEGGLDVVKYFQKIKAVVSKLKKNGIEVSLFIDPEKKQIDAAKKSGVGIIELHTGRYADAKDAPSQDKYFHELVRAVSYGRKNNLIVNAGHGLNYYNVQRIAEIKGIEELNIGYSIVCRAALVGVEQAVQQMKKISGGS